MVGSFLFGGVLSIRFRTSSSLQSVFVMDEKSAEFLDAMAIQVARVVMAAGYLEDSLCAIISGALRLSVFQGNAVVRPMASRAKLDLIERLAKTYSETMEDRADVLDFTKRAKKALEERNDVIHGQFGHNPKGETIVRTYSGKKKLTGGPQRLTLEQISELGTTLMSLSDESDDIQIALSKLASAHEMRSLER